MLTLLFSIGTVYGIGLILFGFILCAALYLAIALPIGRCPQRAFAGLLMAEIFTDTLWALYFYDGTAYVNHGISGGFILLLWPFALLLLLPFAINRKS